MLFTLYVPALIIGALFGSFLNVVIYRLPLGISVIKPRSACRNCAHVIRWYENIPVLSYLLLRGRCADCGDRISARYPAVESAGVLIAAAVVWRWGYSIEAILAFAFLMALLAVMLIDWDHRIIPDEISLSFIVVGIVWSFFNPGLSFLSSILGAIVGGGSLWLVGALYKLARKQEGMGGGDIKLMGMIGAFLGVQLVLPVIVLASFFGSIYGIYLLRAKGGEAGTAVAFGSFLAPSAGICIFFGNQLLGWYFTRF
ncbi:MAG: prepilin peptidase [Candidatus Krumholzibacteriota bacterium]|nr:prepilin peptidase [Candidatus Krumholzibacteriota bacterium]